MGWNWLLLQFVAFLTMRAEQTCLHSVGTRSATDLTTWPDVVPTAERTLENVDDVDVQE